MARDDISEMTPCVYPPRTFASVCSGIEAASAAWEPLGWKCLWLAEIDKAASAVLAHHFPDVPNLGDLVALPDRMLAGEMDPPDVLIGGTPCQSFSVAGLRGGMADARGALTLAFVRLVDAIDMRRAALGLPPVLIVWENVPGVLTHKENPFGCFLGALAGENLPLQPSGRKWTHAGLVSGPQRTIAWRVLDAQYFGLAQRRNRVFVVASADFRTDPGAILFECEGMRRDSPPRRETGEGATHPIASSLTNSGRGIARAGDTRGQDPVVAVSPIPFDTTQISSPDNYSSPQAGDPCHPLAAGAHPPAIAFSGKGHGGDAMMECAPTLRASGHMDSHANAGAPPAVIYAIQERAVCENPAAGPDGVGVRADNCAYTLEARSTPQAVCVTGSVTHALKADGFDGSEDGTGRGQPITVYGFQPHIARNGRGDAGEIINALTSQAGQTGKGDAAPCVATGMRVRRLMPIECERLQGFPDHWTLAKAHNGRPVIQADGPRYKQLGNSMAVPIIRWLGERIQTELTA